MGDGVEAPGEMASAIGLDIAKHVFTCTERTRGALQLSAAGCRDSRCWRFASWRRRVVALEACGRARLYTCLSGCLATQSPNYPDQYY